MPDASPLRIATRNSPLARTQSCQVGKMIEEATGRPFVLVPVVTTGDTDTQTRLQDVGGSGFFTTEVEEAVRRGNADLAVHSLKDLPIRDEPDVHYIFPRRVEPFDVLVPAKSTTFESLADLPQNAAIATSSPRRAALLSTARPDIRILEIRGNVDTRIRKIDEGYADAVVLARAGLYRLGIDRRFIPLDPVEFPPAAGQGALAVQTFRTEIAEIVGAINDPETRTAVLAERLILAELGGGCQNAVGAWIHRTPAGNWRIAAAGKRADRLIRFDREDPEVAVIIAETIAYLKAE